MQNARRELDLLVVSGTHLEARPGENRGDADIEHKGSKIAQCGLPPLNGLEHLIHGALMLLWNIPTLLNVAGALAVERRVLLKCTRVAITRPQHERFGRCRECLPHLRRGDVDVDGQEFLVESQLRRLNLRGGLGVAAQELTGRGAHPLVNMDERRRKQGAVDGDAFRHVLRMHIRGLLHDVATVDETGCTTRCEHSLPSCGALGERFVLGLRVGMTAINHSGITAGKLPVSWR